mmetsp:Transcript_14053/g.39944  ORF Transcript_14053/g.39944 Transcript_14053/m.39944 type:complete len:281 (-) Transcript_14053:281-1123(-)
MILLLLRLVLLELRRVDDVGGRSVTLHPRVIQHLLGSQPLARLLHEEGPDQALGIFRDVVPAGIVKVILHIHDLLEQRGGVVGVEGRVPAQQNVEDDPNGPHVNALVVAFTGQHLRGDITRGTARGHQLLLAKVLRKAKVGDFDDFVLVAPRREKVFGFQIAVGNIIFMQVCYGGHNLADNVCGVLLRVLPALHDLVEQFLSFHQLHDQVELLFVLVHVKQLQNVRMVKLLHDLNLPLEQLDIVALHHAFLDTFDGVLLSAFLLRPLHHNGETTAPNFLA